MNKDLKIFEALNFLRKNNPQIYMLLDLVNISVSDKISTACIAWNKSTKKADILISKSYYDRLDGLNLSAIIEHELLHLLFEHLTDDTMADKKTANIAMDSIINDCVKLFKTNKEADLLDNRVKLKEINSGLFSVEKNTSFEVYTYLIQNPDKMPESGKGENSGTIDDHSEFNSDSSLDEMSETDKQILESQIKEVIKANEDAFKKLGQGSADLSRIVEKSIKCEYNFKSIFENCVKKSLRADAQNTWKKLNRRLGELAKGHKKAVKPNVLLLVDTSGSMGSDSLEQINYQISFLSKYYNFTVAWGDDYLKDFKTIKKGEKINIPFVGGGGTDLNFYQKIKDYKKFDLIIFNTDGHIETLDENCKIKKIIVLYGKYFKEVEGYKNIIISSN